jgi:hypothetical protein
MTFVGRCGLIRLAQASLLTAAAAAVGGYWHFGAFEIAVAMLGASALAASGELALALPVSRAPAPVEPAEPVSWSVGLLEERAAVMAGRDRVADEQRAYLLARLRNLADDGGLLPEDLDEYVRDSFPELVGR